MHPGDRRREHGREPRVAGRALREDLRDQHAALHLLYTKEKLLEPLPPDVQARLDAKK
jgi:hypothetical protein